MPRWNGGVIGAANNPTTSSAKGIWSLSEATKAIRAGLWPPSNAGADPYFENVTLLLPGNGTNGAQNNTFLDSSTNAFTITRNGNTTQGTFTPFSKVDGRWGNYFDGNGDYLSSSGGTATAMGTGDFTWELFVYITATANYQDFIDTRSNVSTGSTDGMALTLNTGTLTPIVYTTSTLQTSTISLVANSWNHVAITRASGTLTFWINGQSGGSAANSVNMTNQSLSIGGANTTNVFVNGYISNVRIVKGTAVYTTAFTPPTTPLTAISGTSLLTCQSNRFIDNSTNAFAITRNGDVSVQTFSPFPALTAYAAGTNGGSGYFDGSGDYLSFAADTALAFGTGDYTVEAWIYLTSVTTTDLQIIFMSGSTGGNNFYFHVDGNQISVGTSTAFISNQSTTITANQWYHIAACRSGTTLRLFVNGTQAGSNATDSTNWISSGTGRVGSNESSAQTVFGYISGLRVVKGTAVYTAAFTPPTAPLTAITNTSLLLSGTNGGIIDAAMSNDLETVGNAQISTTQSKFGGASISLDGTGDYLLMRDSQNFAFGSGDFTIEFWVYYNSGVTSDVILYDGRPSTTNGAYNMIFSNSSGKIVYYVNFGDRITGTTTLTTGTWYHVAVARSGTSTKLFLNGTQEGSTYTDSNTYIIGANRPVIGSSGYSLNTALLNGYIDDLRVTKGYARYTANFTAPTAAFNGFGD